MNTKNFTTYRLLQLNIEGGKYLPAVEEHLTQNDYDFITLQEVGNSRSETNGLDLYNKILVKFPQYQGQFQPMITLSKKKGHVVANVVLWKKSFKLLRTDVIKMQEGKFDKENFNPTQFPFNAAVAVLEVEGQELGIVSGHFVWGNRPYDSDRSILNAKKVVDYLQTNLTSFVLAGDFNVDSRTVTVQQFSAVGENLGFNLGVKNTLNPNTHRVTQLFPQGIACDQIIMSRDLTASGLRVITDKDLSDHYGLETWFQLHHAGNPIGGLEE